MKIWFWVGLGLVAQTALAGTPVRIVILGDSLTEGYGVAKEDAYPALLDERLKKAGYPNISVVNAGISGSTTASAESRLKWHLKHKPEILMVALGANDGLRGLKIEETRKNLSALIGNAQKQGIQVLLAGMQLPPNYGKEYVSEFAKLYPSLATEYQVPLVPFLLKGVGGEKSLNLADGIHPNELGHQKMADLLQPFLVKLLKETHARP